MIKPIHEQFAVRKVTIGSEQDTYGVADSTLPYSKAATTYVEYVTAHELHVLTQKFLDDLTTLNNKKHSEIVAQNEALFNQTGEINQTNKQKKK